MADIKLNYALMDQIKALEDSANALNDAFVEAEIQDRLNLETVRSYKHEQKEIKLLIDIYKKLLEQDVRDLKEMVNHLMVVDKKLSEQLNMTGDQIYPDLYEFEL